MKIMRTSQYSGETRFRDLDVTDEQLKAWKDGQLIQVAMPGLSGEEREWLMTGMTGDEWDEMFGEDKFDLIEPGDKSWMEEDEDPRLDEAYSIMAEAREEHEASNSE